MKKIGKIIPDIVIRSYTNNYNIFQFNEADVLIKQGIIAVQKNNKKDSCNSQHINKNTSTFKIERIYRVRARKKFNLNIVLLLKKLHCIIII